jgi:predicted HTH domain antitoxin
MKDNTIRVELDLPRDLLGALNVTENDLEPRLKRLIALELFREQQISSGKAAELLGMSKAEFVDLLDRHGITYFTETPDELTAQVEAVREKLDRGEQ